MPRCLIGLGANLDGPQQAVEAAIARLDRAMTVVSRSAIHQTDPIGPDGQSVYANAAALVEVEDQTPKQLLELLQSVEHELGRTRGERWGSRRIDLDLLLFDDEVEMRGGSGPWLQSPPELVIPHPWLLIRRFALAPAVEVAPEAVHPILGRTLKNIFFRTLGSSVAPPLEVFSVVGGDTVYRQRLTSTLTEHWQAEAGLRVATVADPSSAESELMRTSDRERAIVSLSTETDIVAAPFEVFDIQPAVIGLIDPSYSLYKNRDGPFAIAARKRLWPYVMLSGDLENDVNVLALAYASLGRDDRQPRR